ncbi:amino acid ABC transporter permease [Arthrobacter sp. zg-Y40]|uniref:amino acid ABC transporter permease n=1 Tax=unclassified Arthrobacter TaxID=235627 RepID=UPI001D135F3D|nr:MULTISPECIES: amino acid ABC transporter permease [unclassified Arthrobacter]MCC3279962.1 amino acid ABC transporter permease [Arthrobacter sp. zg-Y40]MDK1328312.1 amino acid ABC transporter permease [Arthrobacter sp. zg-Y1143]
MSNTTVVQPADGELLPQVHLKRWGRWVSAVVIVAALVLLAGAAAQGDIDYGSIPAYLVSPVILEGLVNTIVLAVVAQVSAIVIGVVIALMRISKMPVASAFAAGYTWLFRGLPVLLQILLWYNLALIFPRLTIGIPFTDVTLVDVSTNSLMTTFVAAFLGLALNESAYMAEIVRAGLKSVDRGQIEAAQSIGETPAQRMSRIVLPQAMRVIIPPTGNDFINMLKGTAMASVIGYMELIKAANNISSFNLQVMETLIAAAIWYMVVVSVASVGQFYLERAFDRQDRSPGGRPKAALLRRKIAAEVGRAPLVRSTP